MCGGVCKFQWSGNKSHIVYPYRGSDGAAASNAYDVRWTEGGRTSGGIVSLFVFVGPLKAVCVIKCMMFTDSRGFIHFHVSAICVVGIPDGFVLHDN